MRRPLPSIPLDTTLASLFVGPNAVRLLAHVGVMNGTVADLARIDAAQTRRIGYSLSALRGLQAIADRAGITLKNADTIAVRPEYGDGVWVVESVARKPDHVAVSLQRGTQFLTVRRPIAEAARTHVGMLVRLALEPV